MERMVNVNTGKAGEVVERYGDGTILVRYDDDLRTVYRERIDNMTYESSHTAIAEPAKLDAAPVCVYCGHAAGYKGYKTQIDLFAFDPTEFRQGDYACPSCFASLVK